ANMAGAIDVFVFLWKIAPLPELPNRAHIQYVNTIAFGICMLLTFTVCSIASRKVSQPIADWLDAGEPADPAMVKRVLRNPLHQALLSAGSWLFGALSFGILNSFYSVTLGAEVGVGIAMGGITTCGLMYLFAQKALHPITV